MPLLLREHVRLSVSSMGGCAILILPFAVVRVSENRTSSLAQEAQSLAASRHLVLAPIGCLMGACLVA